MSKTKHLGEGTILDSPKKKINFTLKDGAVTTSKIADKAVTLEKVNVDEFDERYVENSRLDDLDATDVHKIFEEEGVNLPDSPEDREQLRVDLEALTKDVDALSGNVTDLSEKESETEKKTAALETNIEEVHTKLDTIEEGAEKNPTVTQVLKEGTEIATIGDTSIYAPNSGGGGSVTVDSKMDSTSTNPVQNKVITEELGKKVNKDDFSKDIRNGAAAATYVYTDTNGAGTYATKIGQAGDGGNRTSSVQFYTKNLGEVAKFKDKTTDADGTVHEGNFGLSVGMETMGVKPIATETYNLGNNKKLWKNVYASNIVTIDDEGKEVIISVKDISTGGGSKITVDSTLSSISTNPVQNKVITEALNNKASKDVATSSYKGLMSAEDKAKIDGEGATVNQVLTILENGTTGWANAQKSPCYIVSIDIRESDKKAIVKDSNGHIWLWEPYDGEISDTTVIANTLTYNGSEQSLVTVKNAHGAIHFTTEERKATATDPTSVPTRKYAGTYRVYWYSEGDTEKPSNEGWVDVTINKIANTLHWTTQPPSSAITGNIIEFEASGEGTIIYKAGDTILESNTYTMGSQDVVITASTVGDTNHESASISSTVKTETLTYWYGHGTAAQTTLATSVDTVKACGIPMKANLTTPVTYTGLSKECIFVLYPKGSTVDVVIVDSEGESLTPTWHTNEDKFEGYNFMYFVANGEYTINSITYKN